MNDFPDVYAQYFKFREVGPEFYSDYVLPAYLKQVLPEDRHAAILDIGCGFGQVLKRLRAGGYTALSGIDISETAVNSCLADGLDVAKIDAIDLFCRQAGKRFEVVIMSHVIEHIDKSAIVETLRAVRMHLLKDGGQLLVMTPNAQSHTGCYWAYEDFTHTTIFTAGSLYFVLKCAGFQEIEFIDPLGTAGSHPVARVLKRMLIAFYKTRFAFWNRVTDSSFHRPSPQIFTFELKAIAR